MILLKTFPKNTKILLWVVSLVTAPANTKDFTRFGSNSASCLAKIVPKETPIKWAGGISRNSKTSKTSFVTASKVYCWDQIA